MYKTLVSKITFLLFLVLSFNIVSGQSKYAQKSKKLYEKKKFEKCIITSKKNLGKDQKSIDLQYYIVVSNLALYQNNTSQIRQYSYLKKSISAWIKLKKYNSNQKDFSKTEENIKTAIYNFCETDYIQQNRQKNQVLQDKLAQVFSDTTESYRSIHFVPKKSLDIKIDKSVADIRQKILENAIDVIGVRYKYGGTDSTGFDCSGFTQYIYKSVGIDLPHNANSQSKIGNKIKLEDAKAGDLIFFGKSKAFHAGMIFKNNNGKIELIHCVSGGVNHQNYSDENTKYWLKRVLCVKQIIKD